MAAIVYNGAARRIGTDTGLFYGITFWLSRQVPSRARFKDDIVANGGVITEDESSADMKIHDHARKTIPPGTYSYTWIEQCMRTGTLVDKEDHRAGVIEGVQRQPGDITQPTKGSKTPFTKEEDCLIWDHLSEHLKNGGGDGGNRVYQDFALMYPRHTFQSWRDRWRKRLKGRPRPLPLVDSDPTTPTQERQPPPPASRRTNQEAQVQSAVHDSIEMTPRLRDRPAAVIQDSRSPRSTQSTEIENVLPTERDEITLMVYGDDIIDVDPANLDMCWQQWAEAEGNDHLTAKQWRDFWEQHVRVKWELANSGHPSQRNKANSSKRVTTSRSQTTNSQSTESQHTSQENGEPVAGTKRKRAERLEKSGTGRANKRRSQSKHSTVSANGHGQHEEQSLFVEEEMQPEAIPASQTSLSLTEPTQNNTGVRKQDKAKVHLNNEIEDDKESQDQSTNPGDLDARPKGNGGVTGNDESQGSQDTTQPLAAVIPQSSPPPETQEEQPTSSYSFTTTPPGNTQKQRNRTPTPRRRNQIATSSSQFTTTPPGNTAPAPPTSSLSVVQDSQEERARRLLHVTGAVGSSESAVPESQLHDNGTSQDTLEELTQPAVVGDSYDFQPDAEVNRVEHDVVNEPDDQTVNDENESADAEDLERAEASKRVHEFWDTFSEWGYSDEHIDLALQASTWDTIIAERAVRFLRNRGKLPDNVPGIFTAQDDLDLIHPTRQARVVKLHGKDRCQQRQEYLADLEEEDDDLF